MRKHNHKQSSTKAESAAAAALRNKKSSRSTKQNLRHTTYRSENARDDNEELSIIDTIPSDATHSTPEDWDTNLLLKGFLTSLDPIDQAIVIGRLQNYGQTEIALQIDISQPAVNKRLKKLQKLFQENLA
ncbi:hypothetical protein [Canibacter zhoujuaniae]|uniref:hypothetical protein n=1 Tax=Canibacter zhoujuaniae TaxID=2708343 RepID=UPI0014226C81|nr:hypothetical protein [Canibacter zhoujuaniae]